MTKKEKAKTKKGGKMKRLRLPKYENRTENFKKFTKWINTKWDLVDKIFEQNPKLTYNDMDSIMYSKWIEKR